MRYLICLMPALFWGGVFLIFDRSHWGLKERAEAYMGKISETARSSELWVEIRRLANAGKKEKYLEELSQSLSYIKNITLLGIGKNISAGLLLEELSEICPLLSSSFLDMSHSLSVNDKGRAQDALWLKTKDPYAKDIGSFLANWEDIPQQDLLSSIDAYDNSLRMERTTRLKRRDEMISDIVYFPVILNCMAVLMNFIYVAYFIEQKDAFMLLF